MLQVHTTEPVRYLRIVMFSSSSSHREMSFISSESYCPVGFENVQYITIGMNIGKTRKDNMIHVPAAQLLIFNMT